MRSKINLLAMIPNPKDSTSLYRGVGPLGDMHKQNPRLNINFAAEYSWVTFSMNDVFFLQRPYSQNHVEMVQLAKDNKCPVWVDYDDDLFSVPESNPAYRVYSNDVTRRNVARIVAMADAVTVSTPYLKRQFELGPQPLNKNIVVVPNAMDLAKFGPRVAPPAERKRIIAWRGSHTHHKDLHVHMETIVKNVNSDSTWKWVFQGDKPWFLFERLGNNAVFIDSMDPIVYFKTMHDMKPPVMIVPLHECDFNKSKSNIAWLEGAFFGAMTLGPNWEEWDRPGCIKYDGVGGFNEQLSRIMAGEYDPTAQSNDAWEYVMDNLQLSHVNKLRLGVLEKLLG